MSVNNSLFRQRRPCATTGRSHERAIDPEQASPFSSYYGQRF